MHKQIRFSYTISTNQFINIGDYEMALCSDTREAIEEFLSDWSLKGDIEEMDSVEQSG